MQQFLDGSGAPQARRQDRRGELQPFAFRCIRRENHPPVHVLEAMAIWRVTNGCTLAKADTTDTLGVYQVQRWTDCQPETDLKFTLHDGGHSIQKGWAQKAIDWFEAR